MAEVVAEIAERERKTAVRTGDYAWALLCAMIERQARMVANGVA